MKTMRSLFLSFTLLSLSASAQTIHVTAGGQGIEKAHSLVSTSDKGLILVGETNSNPTGNGNALMIKLDQNGKLLWSKTYGSAVDKENFNDIKPTPDKGYIVIGERYLASPKGRGEVGILLKTDPTGNTQWWKEFDHNGNEAEGFSIQITLDKGYVIGGMMKNLEDVSDPFFSVKAEKEHLYALKTDKDGNSEWAGFFSGNYGSKALFIQQTRDNGYILTGHVYKSSDPANTNICLTKLDQDGKLSWVKVYDNLGKKEETGMTVYQTADEGYIVCGTTYDYGAGDADVFLIKTTASGEISWSKTYGGTSTELAKSMIKTAGGYLICGATKSFGAGSLDGFLLQVDNNGNVGWFNTYGTSSYEMPLRLIATQNGYAMTGLAINSSASSEVYSVSTDEKGDGTCSMSHNIKTGNFTLAPIIHETLTWELSQSTSIVKTTQNGSSAEAAAVTVKQSCAGTK